MFFGVCEGVGDREEIFSFRVDGLWCGLWRNVFSLRRLTRFWTVISGFNGLGGLGSAANVELLRVPSSLLFLAGMF